MISEQDRCYGESLRGGEEAKERYITKDNAREFVSGLNEAEFTSVYALLLHLEHRREQYPFHQR